MDRLLVRWEKVIEVELGVPRRMVMEKVVDAPFVFVALFYGIGASRELTG